MEEDIQKDKKNTGGILPVMKVLIVDDEIDICYLLNSLLQQHHIQSGFVTSIKAAKAALEASPPALMLLDNHLPDGRGMDFIPFVREHYPAVRIIMITAYDGHIEKETALASGASAFISKPFTQEEILNAVLQK